jgi:hypothetical protein
VAPDDKRQLNVRLDGEEESRLERVSKHYGLSGPDLLRMLLKREEAKLFGGRPTWRRLAELVFAERELGRDTTRDRIAIELSVLPQKARNAALLLTRGGALKETTKPGANPNFSPGRTFAPKHQTLEKTINAIKDIGLDPDEDV